MEPWRSSISFLSAFCHTRGEDPILECIPIVVIEFVDLIPTLTDLMPNFFDNIVPILVTKKLLVQ